MKPPKGVTLVSAKYHKEYMFLFSFSNGKESIVDFKPIITHGESLLDFLNIPKFKKINLDKERGDIYWGKDYDMCFHIESIYGETEIKPRIKSNAGRKPLKDKKVLLPLYVYESIIEKNGGKETAQKKCEEFLNEK